MYLFIHPSMKSIKHTIGRTMLLGLVLILPVGLIKVFNVINQFGLGGDVFLRSYVPDTT